MRKRVLFVGSHCDDIELGCGSTLHKHQNCWDIMCLVLNKDGPERKHPDLHNIALKSLSKCGVTNVKFFNFEERRFNEHRQQIWEALRTVYIQFKPDTVYTQSQDDHQDHVITNIECKRVFHNCSIIEYNIPRSNQSFVANYFEVISSNDVIAKIDALKHYREIPEYGAKYYFEENVLNAQLRYHGVYVEEEFVEAFHVNKIIHRM